MAEVPDTEATVDPPEPAPAAPADEPVAGEETADEAADAGEPRAEDPA